MSMNNSNITNDRNKADRHKRRAVYIIAGGLALIGATFSVQAIADNKLVQHAFVHATDSNPFVHQASWGDGSSRHFFGRERTRFSNLSDEQIEKRVNRVVRHISIEIDATKEQEAKITTLITEVVKDMRPMREEWRSVGFDFVDTLSAKSVDRAKLETLRKSRLADVDKRSQRIVKAMADVADVLTQEQRATLKDRIETLRSWRGRGRWYR